MNFDGVAKANDIHVINEEVTLGVKYNSEFAELVVKAAKNLGLELTNRALPFGATDGSAIVQGGFPNGASMEAMDIDTPEAKTWYHTLNDTADKVEPEALEIARNIAIEYLKLLDEKA